MAANLIAPPTTVEDFLEIHGDDDGNRFELIDGEVCERPVTGYSHDLVKNRLKELFDEAGAVRLGFSCWIEHSFRMGDSSAVTPDVAVIRSERLSGRTGNSLTAGAPEIAIEVAINDKPSVLQRKISAYLENGAHAVCCAYPDLKTIVVYTSHEWRKLAEDDRLEFPTLLPGISIPVAAVFAEV